MHTTYVHTNILMYLCELVRAFTTRKRRESSAVAACLQCLCVGRRRIEDSTEIKTCEGDGVNET